MHMSWVKAAKAITPFALSVAALAIPGAASAAIVVASSGPSAREFPAGKKLADNQSVTLRAGDSVTVLDSGGTRVLRGAGSFTLGQQGQAASNPTFAALTRQRGAQRVRTGAVRNSGPAGPVKSPNLWYVDISQPGTKCIVDPAAVVLWRADPAQPAQVTIGTANGASAAASFAAGAMVAPWDITRAPIAEGVSYTLAGTGAAAQPISFALLGTQPETPESLAEALIAKGCTSQLTLLSESLARPAS